MVWNGKVWQEVVFCGITVLYYIVCHVMIWGQLFKAGFALTLG